MTMNPNYSMNPQAYAMPGYPGYPAQNVMFPQHPTPALKNLLNDEELKELRALGGESAFKLTEIDKIEMLKARCNHKYNGEYMTIDANDGTGAVKCKICGTQFHYSDLSEVEVAELTQKLVDVLETAKTIFHELPVAAAREYMQIIPLIKKAPELFRLANLSFSKYDMPSGYNQANVSAIGAFNMLMGGMPMGYAAPMPMGAPGYPQPMYAQPGMAAPQGYYPAPGYPVQGGNPFGYSTPQPAPVQQAAPNAPVETSQAPQVPVQQVFNV